MARPVRVMSADEWERFCSLSAAAAPPNADDTGVQDAETGEEITETEWLIRVEAARRERRRAAADSTA